METVETLLVIAINCLSGQGSQNLVNGLSYIALHYNELLQIVRWTVPCVIMSGVLLCLLSTDKKTTE
jgi:hypothetical protein